MRGRDGFLSYVRMSEWHDIHGQIMDVLKGEFELKLNLAPGEYPEIHRALLSGLLSNVSLRQEQNEYLGARGPERERFRWQMEEFRVVRAAIEDAVSGFGEEAGGGLEGGGGEVGGKIRLLVFAGRGDFHSCDCRTRIGP